MSFTTLSISDEHICRTDPEEPSYCIEQISLYLTRLQSVIYTDSSGESGPYPPPISLISIVQSFVGSFLGILAIAGINSFLILDNSDKVFLIGSFGAQAVILYGTPNTPVAQPYNCIVGNVLSAFVGVSCYKIATAYDADDDTSFGFVAASALAVSISTALMLYTRSIHPPGGATALIAVIGSERVHDLGYTYIIWPTLLGSLLNVFMAILLNNLNGKDKNKVYPRYWSPIIGPIEPRNRSG
jgi:CBS-domain-containing membrane protein